LIDDLEQAGKPIGSNKLPIVLKAVIFRIELVQATQASNATDEEVIRALNGFRRGKSRQIE
jgi:hypothetical protein